MKRLLTILIILGIGACGKQGPPRPPVPQRPATVSDLVVAQRGPTVVLTWSYPALAASGETLDRVDRIIVYRLREELPPELQAMTATQVDMATGSAAPTAIELFQRVPPVAPQRFRVLAEKILELSRDEIPPVTAGALVVVEDRPVVRSENSSPYRYVYGVSAVRGREESDLSNLVSIVAIDVPVPPESPVIETTAGSVVLRWAAPVRTVLGAEDPEIEGYNVYRLPATGGIRTAKPINETPVQDTDFQDTPPYGSWRYAVTAVRHSGPPVHESQFPLLATVEFVDRQPPPVPEDLTPLVEERVIRLIWSGVEAPDLAGYRVYRQPKGAQHVELTTEPITRTSLVDENPEPGVEYRYGVTSVDVNGNESVPVVTSLVLIPK